MWYTDGNGNELLIEEGYDAIRMREACEPEWRGGETNPIPAREISKAHQGWSQHELF